MAEDNATPTKKNVYISLHKSFIHENIKYTDRKTGEEKTFNVVRLPKDTVIDGKDMGGFEFSPLYVNPSKFRGENWRDIPLLADREVQLRRDVRDIEGNPHRGRRRQAREGGREGQARADQDRPLRGAQALRRGARERRPRPLGARRCGQGGVGLPRQGGRRAPFGP